MKSQLIPGIKYISWNVPADTEAGHTLIAREWLRTVFKLEDLP